MNDVRATKYIIALVVYIQKYNLASRKASGHNTFWILFDRCNLDKGVSCGTLLTDLSKDFDGIVHDFLISKLEAYGFIYEALHVRKNYLKDKTQKKNYYCISFFYLLIGVPQGSLLGPLLCNIYTCDIFFLLEKSTVNS